MCLTIVSSSRSSAAGRIARAPGMHRRHLDDRAARRHQPVEATALRQRADRPGVRPAAQTAGIDGEIRRGSPRDRAPRSSASSLASSSSMRASRKSTSDARQDHADVDLLAALHPRHDADDRVVVGVFSGHATASSTNARGGVEPLDADSARRPPAAPRRRGPSAGRQPAVRESSSTIAGDDVGASALPPSSSSTASSAGARRSSTWSLISGNGSRARAAARSPSRARDESTASRHGRSARGGGATSACSCCAACGRRW